MYDESASNDGASGALEDVDVSSIEGVVEPHLSVDSNFGGVGVAHVAGVVVVGGGG